MWSVNNKETYILEPRFNVFADSTAPYACYIYTAYNTIKATTKCKIQISEALVSSYNARFGSILNILLVRIRNRDHV
jgi:hypothetical protein